MTVALVTATRRRMIWSVGDYRDIYDELRQDKKPGVRGGGAAEP